MHDADVRFVAPVQAMGMSSFLVSGVDACGMNHQDDHTTNDAKYDKLYSISNAFMRLDFDPATGLAQQLAFVSTKEDNSTENTMPFSFDLAWYNSSDGLDSHVNRGQSSGAYIFRPNGKYSISDNVKLEIVDGPVVSEARQTFNEWGTLVTRLYRHTPYLEVEWTVGPLPLDDVGREVVLTYRVDPQLGELWTDANGRAMIRRLRKGRFSFDSKYADGIAANYYPITAAAVLQDPGAAGAALTVLTDRAHGAASLRAGELEIMLHRRTVVDDRRGVEEPLNEQQCDGDGDSCEGLVARGRHRVLLESERTKLSAMRRRQLQQELNDDPLIAFSPAALYESAPIRSRSLLGSESTKAAFGFPLHVLTLQETDDRTPTERTLLLRVGHQLDDVNTLDAGRPRWVSLGDLVDLVRNFGCSDMKSAREVSLSANQGMGEFDGGSDPSRPKFRVTGEVIGDVACEQVYFDHRRAKGDAEGDAELMAGSVASSTEAMFRFDPMQVRTFEVVCRTSRET